MIHPISGECSWKKTLRTKLRVDSDKEIRHVTSDAECRRLCLDEEQFECRSHSYNTMHLTMQPHIDRARSH